MGDVFTTTAIITGIEIRIEVFAQYAGTTETIATENRPDSFADADAMLAFHGFRRVRPWDLDDNGVVAARAAYVQNRFNGTVAARLWEAVGTTHDQWEVASVQSVCNGDLISDMETSEPYVVAGSRMELSKMRVHMVRDGGIWEERNTADFPAGQLVQVARKR